MYRVYDSLGNFIKAFLHTNRQATISLPLVTMVGLLNNSYLDELLDSKVLPEY